MSRFVRRPQAYALGVLAAIALGGPALADAAPSSAADPCLQWASPQAQATAKVGAAPACRPAPRSVRRHAIRTAMGAPRPAPFVEIVPVLPPSRYVSLLILGVGY